MMKKRWIPCIVAGLIASPGYARLSIEVCYEKARANYPLIKQYRLIERSRDYTLSNASKAYLPQFQLSAKATFQSEVTKIPVDFSKLGIPVEIPEPGKDQYGASLEVSQVVWDGGLVEAKRQSIRAKSEADEKELDVSLYAIRERVNQLFFGILLGDAMAEQNRLFQDELQRNYNQVSSLMQNGLANQADLDAVKVEQLKAQQGLTQILHNRTAFLELLSAFIGEKLENSIVLLKPDVSPPLSQEIERPELALFDAQFKTLEVAKKEINADLMPKLSLFLTGGYGKPGLNMLKDDFSAYCIGGIRLSWNLGSFYTRKNRLHLLESGRNAVQVQRETFLFNTALNQTGKNNEIEKYRELLKTDDEIIALRNSVKRASEAKVENGVLSATDLMRDVTGEQWARQEKILHEIEMIQAIYHLKWVMGDGHISTVQ